MRELYISLVFVFLATAGFAAPFAFGLGYVWVDIFYPQVIASLLSVVPVALITGGGAILGYLLMDRRSPPRLTLATCDWAVKGPIFCLFIPFIFRTRVQIESFLLVYMFGAAANIIPFGIKTLLGSGGYGKTLGLMGSNIGLGEGSSLATVSIAMIPFLLYFWNHSLILPATKWRNLMLAGLLVCAVMAPIGTVARTAMVGFAVVFICIWLRSTHKFLIGSAIALVVVVVLSLTSASWFDRMSTVENPTAEASAAGRLLIWKWTWNYVLEHPQGGGFDVFRINVIEYKSGENNGVPLVERGRAFHSMYFEVLGEHGFVGFGLFISIIVTTILYLRDTLRKTRNVPGLEWCNSLAFAMLAAFLSIIACGAFIGIAFQPVVWYFATLPISLREYVYRVQRQDTAARANLPAMRTQRLLSAASR